MKELFTDTMINCFNFNTLEIIIRDGPGNFDTVAIFKWIYIWYTVLNNIYVDERIFYMVVKQ